MEKAYAVREGFLLSRDSIKYGHRLSKTAHSVVYQGTCNGNNVAIKILHDETQRRAARELAEARATLPLHLLVVQLIGFCPEEGAQIMELCQGNTLAEYLDTNSTATRAWKPLRRLGRDVAEGLSHLHRHNVAHGNVSIDNVLTFLDGYTSEKRGRLTPFSLVQEGEETTKPTDIYRFGLVLHQLVERVIPFNELVEKGSEGALRSLIFDCLKANPQDRPSIEEVARRFKKECKILPEIEDKAKSYRSNIESAVWQLLFQQPTELRIYGVENSNVTMLAEALTQNSSLKKLVVEGRSSETIDCEGIRPLANVVKDSHLVELAISRAVIRAHGAQALAEAIGEHPTLQRVSLAHNQLDGPSACLIANSLRFNTRLTDLDLSCNRISGRGVAAFGSMLESNRSLKKLRLSYSWATAEGIALIANALETNQTLEDLDLQSSAVDDVGAAHLARALCHNTSLLSLKLAGNNMTGQGVSCFHNTLQVNQTLRELFLSAESDGQEIYEIGELLRGREPATGYESRVTDIPDDEVFDLAEDFPGQNDAQEKKEQRSDPAPHSECRVS